MEQTSQFSIIRVKIGSYFNPLDNFVTQGSADANGNIPSLPLRAQEAVPHFILRPEIRPLFSWPF